MERERDAAESEERLVLQVLECDRRLREEDRAQHNKVFERLLVAHDCRFQCQHHPESPPHGRVLQPTPPWDSSGTGRSIPRAVNTTWYSQMYPAHSPLQINCSPCVQIVAEGWRRTEGQGTSGASDPELVKLLWWQWT